MSASQMKRVPIAELLDSDAGTPAEIAASLSDLYRINRWFGGIATTQTLVERIARKLQRDELSLLEVAAGGGAAVHDLKQRLQARGIRLHLTLLDRAASHLAHGSRNGTRAVSGDALALPFQAGSFDLVSSCLFVHHLAPREAVQFLHESLRVCRHVVLVNDLIRHPLHLGLVYAGLPLFRSRLTWHDAPASVRQAYTSAELRNIVSQTGAKEIEITRHFLYRAGVVAWK